MASSWAQRNTRNSALDREPARLLHFAASAIEFYKKAFGATELMRLSDPGGRVGHAEIKIGDSPIMLADEHPEIGARGPRSLGGSPVGILLYVEDVDALASRAGSFEDPFGHTWHIHTRKEELTSEELNRRAAAQARP